MLNGGGLGQIQDITAAFSTAFRGREQDLRSLIEQLDKFTAYLNDQKGDIIAATDSLNNLVGQFAAQKPVLDKGVADHPRRAGGAQQTSATTSSRPPTSWANSALSPPTRSTRPKRTLVKELTRNRTGAGVAGQRRAQPDAIAQPDSDLPVAERDHREMATR